MFLRDCVKYEKSQAAKKPKSQKALQPNQLGRLFRGPYNSFGARAPATQYGEFPAIPIPMRFLAATEKQYD